MNEILSRTRHLSHFFATCVAVLFLYVLASATGVLDMKRAVMSPGVRYNLEIFGVLLTLVAVPSSLKLFYVILKSKVDESTPLKSAARIYFFMSYARILLLSAAALFSAVVYFVVSDGSSAGILCFFICIIAMFFCIPGKKRTLADLNLE